MDDIPELVVDLETPAKQSPVQDQANLSKTSELIVEDATNTTETETETEIDRKIPITIITGYLGSGKLTLLQHISQVSNKRLAIILNEFGDSSAIEKSVTIQNQSEAVQEWLDLGNGCLCCTVKDNGVLAIEELVRKSKNKIDYILLETTGIADPAPIAKMFWIDDGLASNVYIDGVVTVVDAKNIVTCLEDVGGHWHKEHQHMKMDQALNKEDITNEELQEEKTRLEEGLTTAHLQLALADTVLINKVDLLGEDESLKAGLDHIESKIRDINSVTPIHTTSFGDIDINKILDLHAFEANESSVAKVILSGNELFHDGRIATVTLKFPFFTAENEFQAFESFIQHVLWENDLDGTQVEVHRAKGLLVCEQENNKYDVRVLQAVRDTYDIIENAALVLGVTQNQVVLIGKNLTQLKLERELQKYVKTL